MHILDSPADPRNCRSTCSLHSSTGYTADLISCSPRTYTPAQCSELQTLSLLTLETDQVCFSKDQFGEFKKRVLIFSEKNWRNGPSAATPLHSRTLISAKAQHGTW